MLRVKICGITRQEDVLAAAQAGADAIGFQFYKQSARYITPERAALLAKNLPPFLSVVGVFVNDEPEEVRRIAELCHLDYVQLHGNENPNSFSNIPCRIIKAVRVERADDLIDLERFSVDALLLDAKVGDLFGGTGQCFDWSLLKSITTSVPLILAGGLRPENIASAVKIAHPQAVDVSSGVESAPGIKSFDKMRSFIQNAHQAADE
jgi:phosphoribosylanthranilate isomerase